MKWHKPPPVADGDVPMEFDPLLIQADVVELAWSEMTLPTGCPVTSRVLQIKGRPVGSPDAVTVRVAVAGGALSQLSLRLYEDFLAWVTNQRDADLARQEEWETSHGT